MNKNKTLSLTTYGLKNTSQRKALYELLQKQNQPVKAEDLYKELQNKNIAISLSTIYRILDAFLEKGIVSKTTIDNDGVIYYEVPSSKHFHHLICLSCHKIVNFENCPVHDFEDELANKTNFAIAYHQLDVYGYCPECLAKMKEKHSTIK